MSLSLFAGREAREGKQQVTGGLNPEWLRFGVECCAGDKKMNSRSVKIAVVSALLLGASTVAAEQAGWFGGVSVDRSQARAGGAGIAPELATTRFGAIGSSAEEGGYRFHVGYQLSPGLSLEGRYTNFGKVNHNAVFSAPLASAVGSGIKAEGWNVDVVGAMPVNRSFSLYGKVGALVPSARGLSLAPGGGLWAVESDKARRTVPGLGLGMEYAFSSTLGLRGAFERYYRLGMDESGRGDFDRFSIDLNYRF